MQQFDWQNPGSSLTALMAWSKPVFGFGMSAYNRILPGFFLPNFTNVCALDSLERPLVSKNMKVLPLTQVLEIKKDTFGTEKILLTGQMQKYLQQNAGSYLLPYRNSPKIEALGQKMNFMVIGNSGRLVDFLEQKANFLKIAAKAGVKTVPGETVWAKDICWEKICLWQKKYRSATIVMQMADLTKGGGAGLLLVKNKNDFNFCRKKIKYWQEKEHKTKVRVSKYIYGEAPSMTCCLTKYGLLTSQIRARPIGLFQLIGSGRPGAFCGHDWTYRFSSKVDQLAEDYAQKIGHEMALLGYKGIFGLDFLVDKQTSEVYVTECNPRHLGTEPVSGMAQMERGEVPADVFDLLEHLGLAYEFDFSQTKKQYKKRKNCSQLMLFNRNRQNLIVAKELAAGVYCLDKKGNLQFLRPGYANWHIRSNEEFIVTDRVPRKGKIIKPKGKIVRLVFKRPILVSRYTLLPEISEIVEKIYQYYSTNN